MPNIAKVAIFYAMALGMSLALALFAAPVIGAYSLPLVMLTPMVSVLIMMLVVTREGYSRAGWRELGLNRLGLNVWGLAIVGPLVVLGVAYGIVWMTGIGTFTIPQNVADLMINVGINIGMGLILCLGEEIGWRGYLLPKLLPYGQKTAMIVSGLMQAMWHIPFIVFTSVYHGEGNAFLIVPLFISSMTVAGIIFGYLRIAGKSTWPAVICHAIFNVYWSLFAAVTVSSSPVVFEYLAGESGVLTLAGVIAMAVWLLYRLEKQPAPVAALA